MGNVLITGATGFLGRYVVKEFAKNNHTIFSISRKRTESGDNNIIADLATAIPELKNVKYDKVVHIAGTAHIFPKTKNQQKAQYDSNYMMTVNLIAAIEKLSILPTQIIFISSVAVYGCDTGVLIKEGYITSPVTAYGNAKLDCEKSLSDWCSVHGVNLLNLRLPLIAGTTPPGNLGDMKRSIEKGSYVRIKNNRAKKSVVLAQDVATLINDVENFESGTYHLTDRYHPSLAEIESAMEYRLKKKIKIILPDFIIRILAFMGDLVESALRIDLPINSARFNKLTNELTFDDTKAVEKLKWKPKPVIQFIKNEM